MLEVKHAKGDGKEGEEGKEVKGKKKGGMKFGMHGKGRKGERQR